jgi:hypothetical protein
MIPAIIVLLCTFNRCLALVSTNTSELAEAYYVYNYQADCGDSGASSYLSCLALNAYDNAIAFSGGLGQTLNTSSAITMYRIVNGNESAVTINYGLYNSAFNDIQARGHLERRRSFCYNNAMTYVVDAVNYAASSEQILGSLSSVSSVVNTILAGISMGSGVNPASPNTACESPCGSFSQNGYSYHYCTYIYTKVGASCTMDETDDLQDAISGATAVSIPDDTVGRCITIYNTGSTVAFFKYIRLNSGILMADISCECLSGWGVPNPSASATDHGSQHKICPAMSSKFPGPWPYGSCRACK